MRQTPHNIEAEQAVLGAILLDQNNFDDARSVICEDDFYDIKHRLIFKTISAVGGDMVAVTTKLKETGDLQKAGGPGYISHLTDIVPLAANVEQYATLVKEAAKKRYFITKASEMINLCYSESEFNELSFLLEKEAFNLSEKVTIREAQHIGEIVETELKRVEKIQAGDIESGIMTGFFEVDSITSGLQPQDLIIIAGRPSMGKSALAFNIQQRVGTDGIPCAAFSLEMGNGSLSHRFLAEKTKINSKAFSQGKISDSSWPKIIHALEAFNKAPIYIDDTPALHIDEIFSRSRKLVRKYGIKLLVIDYMQLAKGEGGSREQEISYISRQCKAMAKELNLPVVALSQLNRDLEKRTDKRPTLSDLRESGAIEQDADVIMFVYRDEVYNKNTKDAGIAEIIIAKQRNGPTGFAKLAWQGAFSSFQNLAR